MKTVEEYLIKKYGEAKNIPINFYLTDIRDTFNEAYNEALEDVIEESDTLFTLDQLIEATEKLKK